MHLDRVVYDVILIGNAHENEAVKAFQNKLTKLLFRLPIRIKHLYIISCPTPIIERGLKNEDISLRHYRICYSSSRKRNIMNIIINNLYIQVLIAIHILKILFKLKIDMFRKGDNNYKILILSLVQTFVFPYFIVRLCKNTLFKHKLQIVTYVGGRASMLALVAKDIVLFRILNAVEFLVYNFSDRLLVESVSSIGFLRLHRWVNKIYIVRQPLEIDFCKEFKPITERKFDLGYFGRLSLEKGFDVFLLLILKVLRYNRKLRLHAVIAGGSDNTVIDKIVQKFAHRINTLLGYKAISYLGWLQHNDMPEVLGDTKMVIIPSRSEGVPNILLEAMLCSAVPITLDVGGIRDIVRNGVTGLVFNDLHTLITKFPIIIDQIIYRDSQILEEMSYKALEHVKKLYSDHTIKLLWLYALL